MLSKLLAGNPLSFLFLFSEAFGFWVTGSQSEERVGSKV